MLNSKRRYRAIIGATIYEYSTQSVPLALVPKLSLFEFRFSRIHLSLFADSWGLFPLYCTICFSPRTLVYTYIHTTCCQITLRYTYINTTCCQIVIDTTGNSPYVATWLVLAKYLNNWSGCFQAFLPANNPGLFRIPIQLIVCLPILTVGCSSAFQTTLMQ